MHLFMRANDSDSKLFRCDTVIRWVVSDILKECSPFIFGVKQSKNFWNAWRAWSCKTKWLQSFKMLGTTHLVPVSRPGRPEFSATLSWKPQISHSKWLICRLLITADNSLQNLIWKSCPNFMSNIVLTLSKTLRIAKLYGNKETAVKSVVSYGYSSGKI